HRRLPSRGSCTTNCVTPVMQVPRRRIGVMRASMTTVHAYTSSQRLIDGASKDFRRGQAAAANLLVPAWTGAAVAATAVLPELINGKGADNALGRGATRPAPDRARAAA